MSFLEMQTNPINRINSIIEKHRIFLNEHCNKNEYSFGFASRGTPYFYVRVSTSECYGGSCWDSELHYKETEFQKFKVIKSLSFFLSTILLKTKANELKKIANYIYSLTKSNEYFEDGYYGNYEKGVSFRFEYNEVLNHIKNYKQNI